MPRSWRRATASIATRSRVSNGWGLGVGGYFHRQITSDRQFGDDVPDSYKARGIGFGSVVKYDSGSGWFVTEKWQEDGIGAVSKRTTGSGGCAGLSRCMNARN